VGISGVIKLTGKNGEVLSPEGVIVNLEPTSSNDEAVSNQEKRQYDVQMKNKTYLPKFMTERKNDQVNFSNNDKIKHNVFSTSAGNGFDLGTFGKGGKNNTVLKTPGIVKVYCNIHPEMAFFISVSQHNYSYITNESGAYEINNLPPGEYRLSAWHIRGEIQQVVNLQMPMSKRDILINTESYVSTSHKNKFGEDYKITPALFKDEFY
jgi:plastocyanin